jgi:hypothetical protein
MPFSTIYQLNPLLGGFCQAAFVRVFFVLFPLGIYIEGKIVQNLRKRKNELLN